MEYEEGNWDRIDAKIIVVDVRHFQKIYLEHERVYISQIINSILLSWIHE